MRNKKPKRRRKRKVTPKRDYQIEGLKKKINKLSKKSPEQFSTVRLIQGFNIFDLVSWSKWLSSAFKTILILGIVVGLIFGTGYMKGRNNGPINVNYEDFIANVQSEDGSKHKVEVRKGRLYFDGEVISKTKIKNFEKFGLYIKPKLFFGIGSQFEPEVGAGFQFLEFKKINLDLFGTQKALYIGVSYDLELPGIAKGLVRNSSIGVAMGKSWDDILDNESEDLRGIIYWSIKF